MIKPFDPYCRSPGGHDTIDRRKDSKTIAISVLTINMMPSTNGNSTPLPNSALTARRVRYRDTREDGTEWFKKVD
jgi:hypothetical protein